MKKVLITGGTGFIGQHCIPFLLEAGFEVFALYRTKIVDDFKETVHWVRADLFNDIECIKELVKEQSILYLMHLAWDVTVGEYKESEKNLNWLEASLKLIKVFAEAGGKRVLTAGTCFEYKYDNQPLQEEASQLMPDTLYGECKVAMYNVIRHFCKNQEIGYAHGRIFFPYGPGDDPSKLIPYIVKCLLEDKEAYCSVGTQVRDYIYVRDVGKMLAATLNSNITGAINIGTGVGLKLSDIYNMLEDILNKPGYVKRVESNKSEASIIVAGNSRRKEVNMDQFEDTKNALHKTVECLKIQQ